MAIEGNLSWRDDGAVSEEGALKHQSHFFGTGVLGADALKVTQRQEGANSSVDVWAGAEFIDSGLGYNYAPFLKQRTNLPLNPADPSNDRIDLIVSYIDKSVKVTDPADNPGAYKIIAVEGTPAAIPEEPDASAIQAAVGSGNPYSIKAEVLRPAGVDQVINDDVTDRREQANIDAALLSTLPNNSVGFDQIENGVVTPTKRSGGFYIANHTFSVGTGTKVLTGFGFKPKYVRLTANRETEGSTSDFTVHASGSAWDNGGSIVQRGRCLISNSTNFRSRRSDTSTLLGLLTNGVIDYAATVTSFDADGITINVATDSVNWRNWMIEAFG